MTNHYQLPISDTLRTAWDKTYGAKKTIWAGIGITFAIMLVLGCLQGFADLGGDGIAGFVKLIIRVISYFLQLGLLYMGICRARDAHIEYQQLFKAFTIDQAFRIIGLYLLQLLIFIPAAIVAFIGGLLGAQMFPGATIIGGILFALAVIILIVLAIRLMLAIGLVLDQNLNPWPAIKMSFLSTKGNELRLFLLILIQLAIVTISAIPFGLGLIWTLPFSIIGYGVIYKRLASPQPA